MSTFNDIDLFGSGPHRFTHEPLGEYVLVNARIDPFQAGSQPIGPLDTIAALLPPPPPTAALKEDGGRTWVEMAFVGFATEGPTDRGRVLSVAYTARFVRFPS